ncbi:hypothetical protein J7E63_20400 [Bacillus sp. ISL-75]|uniref:hypothetical protein n=1 Tax=Bacillus sp. ISL-75 TaxID=2819137 RepID=UPI001BE9EA47|nr:hypothetical protein [Bacillus sp. ISL-75]MBT2729256.1 hypothetical protein [Bacillus sp. ISL-75]
MIGLLLIFILLTAIMLFWSIFRLLFLSENKVQDRVQHYLLMNDEKVKKTKHYQVLGIGLMSIL